jgi:high-affinity iron transporter
VRNATVTTADVTLTQGQKVYAEIPTLGPEVTRILRVTLEPGVYTWRCVSFDGEIVVSRPGRVGGSEVADASPVYIPVPADELSAAVITYRRSVLRGLKVLEGNTDILFAAVRSGDRLRSERDWLTAHLDYERLGAAYDTFGSCNQEINGRSDGLVGGVDSAKFTGFLRLEYGLWHDQPQSVVLEVTASLDRDVRALVKAFPTQLTQITDVPLRAHEIMENALEFELTGDTDEGSNTNLATVERT